jgi:hypothetical protein
VVLVKVTLKLYLSKLNGRRKDEEISNINSKGLKGQKYRVELEKGEILLPFFKS